MARRGYCATCKGEIPEHFGNCPDAGGYDSLYDAEDDAAPRWGQESDDD